MPQLQKNKPTPGGVREMIAIALPMVASLACDTIMIFTDRVFLSRLQPELMSASMGGGLTVFMLCSFFIGLTGYSNALTAQYLGAGKKENCARVITQAMIISLIVWLPLLACRPLVHELFKIMGIRPAQLAPQKMYFDLLMYGVGISLLRNCLSSFFSGIGKTRVVMQASFTAMIMNTFLNYILIFGKFGCPALGIRGAAFGTILGGLSGLGVLAFAYFGETNRKEFSVHKAFHWDGPVMAKLLRFGISPGFELFLNILAFNGMVMLFHAHSLVTATAATVVLNWDMVAFVPLIGVEIGVTSMVGRYMGAQTPETAERAVRSGLKIGIIYSTLIFILFLGFPRILVEYFRPDGISEVFLQAIPTAVLMLRIASIYVLTEAFLLVFIGALRGAGDTFWAMVMSVSIHWIMTAFLFIALRLLGLPPEIGWIGTTIIFLIFSLMVYLRYRTGAWKKIRVLEPGPVPPVQDGFHEPVDL